LLDFGVGWGRLYRLLLNHVSPSNLVGVDIDQECIDLCRAAMPYGTFGKSEPMPPLPNSPIDLDIVYAYSVFSHLAEHAFDSWIRAFHKILKPGGLFVFTTLIEAHLDVWHQQQNGDDPYYRSSLKAAGFDHATWKLRAAKGDFLYVPTGGGDTRDGSFYGEAIVTRRYVEKICPVEGYALRAFEVTKDLPQAYVVLQRLPGIM
jgi:SAM-dependent methyltransferase